MNATVTTRLAPLRARKGQRRSPGLDDATVERFAANHPELVAAIDALDVSESGGRSPNRADPEEFGH